MGSPVPGQRDAVVDGNCNIVLTPPPPSSRRRCQRFNDCIGCLSAGCSFTGDECRRSCIIRDAPCYTNDFGRTPAQVCPPLPGPPPPPPTRQCEIFGNDCISCLSAGCSITLGQCRENCVFDAPCITFGFGAVSAAHVCADAATAAADQALCLSQQTCDACTAAVVSDGPTCAWFGGRLCAKTCGFSQQHCSPRTRTCPGGGVLCPQDVRPCPDGSYVNRQAPLCEFTPCPILPTCPPGWTRTCPSGVVVGLDPAIQCRKYYPCP